MIVLSQRDPRWGEIPVGFGIAKIKDVGCTITVLAEILGTTPDVVNERMKAVKGFSDGRTIGKGNLLVWSYIAKAFPGVSAWRYYGYDNTKVKAAVPNVIVEVPGLPIGGRDKHWVRYVGNQKLHDPWTGRERPTSDFLGASGFTIITGTWSKPGLTKDQALAEIKKIAYGTQDDSTARQQVKDVLDKVRG